MSRLGAENVPSEVADVTDNVKYIRKMVSGTKTWRGAAIILNALMSDRQILIAALVFSYNLQKE